MSLRPPNVTFHDRVETALRDANLHVALDRATSRFTTLRATALASLPAAEAVRDRARLIRAHTLSKLDTYLAQFADAVEAVGGHVHWAADAEAANRIVLDSAHANGVKRVIKGRSMVSEETGLNTGYNFVRLSSSLFRGFNRTPGNGN